MSLNIDRVQIIGLESINLPTIGASHADKFILKGIQGLDPPEVDVFISNTLNQGGVYQNRRPHNREIVVTVGLNPNWSTGQTSADLRTELYGLLTPGYNDNSTIWLFDGVDMVAQTIGYVKKLEASAFSKDPEAQITIACTQPYLSAPNEITIDTSAMPKDYPTFTNPGTAPTGFQMEIEFTATQGAGWWMTDVFDTYRMHLTYNFQIGDTLIINTVPGFRSLTRIRSGVSLNILDKLTRPSVWFMLHGGENEFVTSDDGFDWTEVSLTPQFWGI